MPHEHRPAAEIERDIEALHLGHSLTQSNNPEIEERFQERLTELKRELRARDDTPVVPFRRGSVPPSAPQGRRR